MGGGATNDGIRCPSLDVVGDRPSVNIAFYGAIFTMSRLAMSSKQEVLCLLLIVRARTDTDNTGGERRAFAKI